MLQTLALPGRDWHYDTQGRRQRLGISDMVPAAKGWAKWMVRNFESCSQESEIIMSRCHVIYTIMRGEAIRVGEMIARSIKCMVSGSESYIGHPFVITTLCRRLHVPSHQGSDILAHPERALGETYFKKAVREWERAVAAAAAGPPPAQQQEQHQAPPYVPQQQQQFTDYQLGMAATAYVQHVRMDWGLPHFSPPLMAAVQAYLSSTL
ncbi:hypothetical protein A2U01_0037747, partial [Trifolium medium]|nr:hypothetical protein [Trifolium medium]